MFKLSEVVSPAPPTSMHGTSAGAGGGAKRSTWHTHKTVAILTKL